jgi:hypothetical protein|tara:strand:- start:3636 stop:3842 length:207 start_codon:yes stop_codon:yes gene_type:complete
MAIKKGHIAVPLLFLDQVKLIQSPHYLHLWFAPDTSEPDPFPMISLPLSFDGSCHEIQAWWDALAFAG